MKINRIKPVVCAVVMLAAGGESGETRRAEAPNPSAPLRLAGGLLNGADDATWGFPEIPGAYVRVIYRADEQTGTFVNHPQLAFFKGRMYAAFQLCPANEDSSDSVAVYSSSSDLNEWTVPEVIGPPDVGNTFRASVGWLQDSDRLYALILRRDETFEVAQTEYRFSTDGANWSDLQVLIPDMMGSAGGRAVIPGGRILMLGHGNREVDGRSQRETLVYYHAGGDFSTGWKQADTPQEILKYSSADKVTARGIEPDWFRRPNGELVQVYRDIVRSGYVLASVSTDDGERWSVPLLTDIPDSSNMQCAGNLPDGTCYMITTPGPVEKNNDRLQPRTPLVLWLSEDGVVFDRAFLVRRAPPRRRFEGKSKTFGYSYVGSLVHDGVLYIAYATNKEDIEMSCIPLNSLKGTDVTAGRRSAGF
ncbi:exo-alpha-sialidase [Tichowtungia aerotolerans]|uniref:Sialidase domain-containing protein n=1 Tax=Tichowtungia aerotolerans TaxID=2697043 RepID=A0A6P1M5U4_9BACT|nr:exo-alpha-sialidase [Tichowtungia aerotolerans]QHI69402.1 hypothetical protein GT409_08030 [Tichowtungia aerotolerans]